MDIKFYQYAGHPDTVNKVLENPTTISGVLRQPFNTLNPVFTIRKTEFFAFNYAYIPATNRYYFVDGVNVLQSDKVEIYLRLDVLKTYETQILSATATVEQSDNPDPYISTRDTVTTRKPQFEKVEFENKGLLNPDGTVIMVTIKGDK